MKLKLVSGLAVAALFSVVAASSSEAASITNYRTYRATTATTLTGQGTDDPVIGSTSATANMGFLIGYLPTPALLGPYEGDTVTLTFGVHFNDATGMSDSGDNFRFALFDFNGEGQDAASNFNTAGTDNTDNFRGYIVGVRNGMGTGSSGSIRARTGALSSGDNPFAVASPNNGTAPSLGSIGGSPVTLVSDVNGNGAGANYTGVLKLTRNALGNIVVSGSFIGSNSANGNTFSVIDTNVSAPTNFGAVAFLLGNGINADQAIFTDIDVTAVPEPTSLMLVALAGSALAASGRRFRRGEKLRFA